MESQKLSNILEAILFVAKKPLTLEELEKVCGASKEFIQKALNDLSTSYEGKGLQVVCVASGYHLATRPEYSIFVEKLLNSPIEVSLSPAALEVLSIVAYKQPVTRIEVENIRGVISDGVLKTLLEKRMIREVGRGDGVGRPILYGTTNEFLRHFGLKDLSGLPPLAEGQREETALKEPFLKSESSLQI